MYSQHRRSHLVILAIAFALALTASAPALAEGHEDKESIELGSDDLGKSREELGDRSLPKDDDEKYRGKHGKMHRKHHGECGDPDCEAKHGECKKCHGRKHKGKDRGMGYERCVEKAVRGQSDREEAQRVCRALFPEKPRSEKDGAKRDEKE